MTFAHLSPLANHLWQSTLFAAVAWLLTLALRKNRAAVRYWIWLAASVKFLIPFAWMARLAARFAWRAAPVAGAARIPVLVEQLGQPFQALEPTALPAAAAPAAHLWPAVLLGVWLCGMAVGVVFWIRSARRMGGILRRAKALDLNLPIPVVAAPGRMEPGVFGIWKPALLLPEGITERLTPGQLEAILAHELRHVHRRDNLTAAIHMLVETIFWFHPAAWWIRARLVEERERACDEEVMRMGREPRTYAEGILEVCKLYLESPVVCVSGISGGDLKKRIERIMTGARVHRLGFARKLLLAGIGIAAAGGPILISVWNAPVGRAQSQDTPTFEAAVVRPAPTGARIGGCRIGPGSLTAEAVPLHFLITQAYGVSDYELKGVSGWMDLELYAVSAKAPGPADHAQMMAMLRNLLAERFKLKVHQETRPASVYALVLGRGGSKLQPVGEGAPAAPLAMAGERVTVPIGQTIADLIHWLNNRSGGQAIGRIVVDRTGLQGEYDIRLAFDNIVDPDGKSGRLDGDIPSSLTQQLGLKLQPARADVTFLVIDKAERVPTEN